MSPKKLEYFSNERQYIGDYSKTSKTAQFLCFATYICQFLQGSQKFLKCVMFENQRIMIFLSFFSKKSSNNVWSVCKKYLPLHPQSRGTPLESAEERVL